MLQLLQRGDRSAQESLRPGWAIFYSFHACSETISFGSLDEITLVVCCCFWHDVEGHWTSWLFAQFRTADPDGRHFSLRLLRRVFPQEQLPRSSTSYYTFTSFTSPINQLHLHDIHLLPVMYISYIIYIILNSQFGHRSCRTEVLT